jgi:hypothetical protein
MGWMGSFWQWLRRRFFPAPLQQIEPLRDVSKSSVSEGQRFGPDESLKRPQDATSSPEPPFVSPRVVRRKTDALRRKYEKARMKHDEWVVPGGAEPVKYDHSEHVASLEDLPLKEKQPQDDLMPEFDPNIDRLIVDEWVEGDNKPHVLFEESEFYGVFNFRDTILKQLERYWVYIERMKKNDPGAYGFYKRLGATLLPYSATGTNRKHDYFKKYEGEKLEKFKEAIYLTPWFKKWWPAFGCICIGINPLDEEREIKDQGGKMWTPKFAYFVRLANVPWYVQPIKGGKIYLMTVWWDRPDHRHGKWGVPNTFPIWCSNDGSIIRALKTREAADGSIRAEHDWRIPYAYEEWAKSYGLTAQLHLTQMFCHLAHDMEEAAYATCRVEVSKGDMSAVFGIEPHRCPYFFKDRDVTLNVKGHRQRVFHVVKAHIHDGKAVPMKYRGLKEFEWAGYHVSITVPGLDHFMLPEFNVPMYSYKKKRISKDDMTEPDIAEYLKRNMKRGYGSYNE